MKYKVFELKDDPKTKQAALRLAVHLLSMDENQTKRKENLQMLKNQHQEKIKKLQQKLTDIETELRELPESTIPAIIDQLKLKWSLTEAEILEMKSSLLRQSIDSRQKTLDELKRTGEVSSEANKNKSSQN